MNFSPQFSLAQSRRERCRGFSTKVLRALPTLLGRFLATRLRGVGSRQLSQYLRRVPTLALSIMVVQPSVPHSYMAGRFVLRLLEATHLQSCWQYFLVSRLGINGVPH